MERWTVYCHILIADGRRYIGLTERTVKQRWNDHCYAAKSSKGGRWHFPNAIRLYGKDAFQSEVLGVFDTLSSANAFEKEKILEFDSRNPKKGFNLAEGDQHLPHPKKNPWDRPEFRAKMQSIMPTIMAGLRTPSARAAHRAALDGPEWKAQHAAASRGKTHGPEARAKISAAKVGKPHSPEHRAKLSARIVSSETRAKISLSSKGRVKSPETLAKMSASMKNRPRQTHCMRGHPLDEAYVMKSGARRCRTCHRDRQRARAD